MEKSPLPLLSRLACFAAILVCAIIGLRYWATPPPPVDGVCVGYRMAKRSVVRWQTYRLNVCGVNVEFEMPIPMREMDRQSVIRSPDGSIGYVFDFVPPEGTEGHVR